MRFLFRLLATFSLAVAVIMAVLDATRTVAASQLVTTPLGTSWAAVSPDSLSATEQFVRLRMYPLLWDSAVVRLLDLPGFVVFALLAFLLYAIGRRPARRIGSFLARG